MLHFETVFKNYFADTRISDDHLKEFTEDHLQRLVSNNESGMFAQLLTDTQTAYNGYFGNIASEDLNTAVRKSLTLTTDNLIKTFKSTVSQKEGIIRGLYSANSPTYQEFFPKGLTEYHEATKANIETIMNRMVNISQAHVTDIGNDFVILFSDLRNNYVTARTAQLNKKGEVVTYKTTTKTTRRTLELQLVKNIFYIGYNFPGDTARCLSFFAQHILHHVVHSATDGLGRLYGTITNATTKEPIFNTEIEITGAGIPKAHSNEQGKYRTHNVAIGIYEIKISKQGFQTITQQKEIVDDGDTQMNVELVPEV